MDALIRDPLTAEEAERIAGRVLEFIEDQGYVRHGKKSWNSNEGDDAIEMCSGYLFGTEEYAQVKRAYVRVFRQRYVSQPKGPARTGGTVAQELPMDVVAGEYEAGASLNALCQKYGHSNTAIRRALVLYGVAIDSRRRGNQC